MTLTPSLTAAKERGTRRATVEANKVRESNAADYEAEARRLRQEQAP